MWIIIIIIIINNNNDDALCSSVDLFYTKVLIGDTIFTSLTGDGTSNNLLDHLNNAKV